ncbi:uncharacterized protein LOC106446274 isoform X1 [Brassica napus]|uniref:uncharacterized protein LOC106446274 isoform X1 n=1 Tax=Brassica napus TaxID=3708 RepID=UPI0006AB1627|nr:uncharacterized protein LOC106446274 isoform X1 [Brassica napus]
MRSDEYDKDNHREKSIKYHGLTMDDRGLLHTSSADVTSTSIDSRPTPSIDSRNNPSIVIRYKHLSEEYLNNNTDYDLISDEFGMFRDSERRARGMHGSILNVSKEDSEELFSMHGSNLFCQPKKESATRPSIDRRPFSSINGLVAPEKNNYTKVEIDVLVEEIYRVIRTSDDFHSKRLDDIYYPIDNSISWLTSSMDEMKQNLAMLQKQLEVDKGKSKSIDAHTQTSIDTSILASIDERLAQFEDRLQSFTYRLEGVYYPLRDGVDFLTTRLDAF